jgi:hypothetical protein
MSQDLIYEFLQIKYKEDPVKFWTAKEIRDELKEKIQEAYYSDSLASINRQLRKLFDYKALDVDYINTNFWRPAYRYKNK